MWARYLLYIQTLITKRIKLKNCKRSDRIDIAKKTEHKNKYGGGVSRRKRCGKYNTMDQYIY